MGGGEKLWICVNYKLKFRKLGPTHDVYFSSFWSLGVAKEGL